MPALIIHGHFYQPPRENPWTGIVEEEPGAAPYHDWNERIHAECYQANALAPIRDPGTGVERFVNNYGHISFNFGPTLLGWLATNHRDTYNQIINADHESIVNHGGHGNAIAQAYGHAILPLCNENDLRTQIRWGLADFRFRYGREAESLWLPETACNDAVLSALIEEGLRFVILAPHQAARIRMLNPDGGRVDDEVSAGSGIHPVNPTRNEPWMDANERALNTGVPYRYFHRQARNKSIDVFFYDGPTSRAIAFEKLLRSSRELVDAFARSADARGMINVATDGETYGHHFKFGDLCLAYALAVEAPARGFQITNYGEYLDRDPPKAEVEINNGPDGKGTSWSCSHGVGRWIRDCGCRAGGEPRWDQAWRGPLRTALDYLRDGNKTHFESTGGRLFSDPWRARDESIVLFLDPDSREPFLYEQAGRRLSPDEQWRAATYLELQRMLLLMYTSCGWFFNDISGIETIQILRYAARAIDLMDLLDLPSLREHFLEVLSEAKSNRPEFGTGADIYRRFVEPWQPLPEAVPA
ncbi:MAG: DUF3536 domain-containing protein [Pyrinomonadaceae bacterium]